MDSLQYESNYMSCYGYKINTALTGRRTLRAVLLQKMNLLIQELNMQTIIPQHGSDSSSTCDTDDKLIFMRSF